MALSTSEAFAVYASTDLQADSRKDSFLLLAAERVDSEVFGDQYGEAVALMACHLMALSPATSGSATTAHRGVASTSAEGLSISFGSTPATTGDTASWLASTTYGANYLSIKRGRAKLYAQSVRVTSTPGRRRYGR
jgi:hypothetical protein